MVSYKGDFYKLLLVQVIAAPTIPVSADSFEGSFGDTIDIEEHLLEVPIHEELKALRDRVDVAEVESNSLRATIRTMRAVETVPRNRMRDERQTCIEIEHQLASVQESHHQDREDFKKLKEFMTSQYGYRS
ncbi:hypothetical protein Tco_0390112 [Tanacetum coccineum]